MAQKKRKSKTSNGVHGAGGKTALSPLQKVLLGGGSMKSFKPLGELK